MVDVTGLAPLPSDEVHREIKSILAEFQARINAGKFSTWQGATGSEQLAGGVELQAVLPSAEFFLCLAKFESHLDPGTTGGLLQQDDLQNVTLIKQNTYLWSEYSDPATVLR